jgi:GxxExxY protein
MCADLNQREGMTKLLHGDITEKILGAAFAVHNALGKGLSEKTYENALSLKLQQAELKVEQQKALPVYFEGQKVGEQIVDLVIEGCVLVEVKAVQDLTRGHKSQLLGYLKNTNFELGLLINFGDRVEFERLIYSFHNH